MLSLQDLTQQLIACDPETLAAECAPLTRENQELTDLLDVYKHVPVRTAWAYTREAHGLPSLSAA